MGERVKIEIADNGVATVTLNRAEKMNALDKAMFEQIAEAGESLKHNRDVRAVVLHGDGRAFCAGLDLSMFTGLSDGSLPELGSKEVGKAPNFYQKIAWVWKEVPVPVIAAVHGVCFGGGLQLALAADMRYVHPESQMSVMESKWGLVPDMSGTQTLRDLVRLDVAKELTFTGRIVSGEEAASLGLATSLSDEPLQKALDVANSIVARSPDAATYAKQLFEQSWHGDTDFGLLLEETLQHKIIGSQNQMESVMAGMQKREANFSPRLQDGFYEGEVYEKD